MRDNLDPELLLLKNGRHNSSNTEQKFTIQPAVCHAVSSWHHYIHVVCHAVSSWHHYIHVVCHAVSSWHHYIHVVCLTIRAGTLDPTTLLTSEPWTHPRNVEMYNCRQPPKHSIRVVCEVCEGGVWGVRVILHILVRWFEHLKESRLDGCVYSMQSIL